MTAASPSWTKPANNDPARLVRDAVWWRRCLGMKQSHALEDAAPALGLTYRKARSLLRGEPAVVTAYQALKARWWADMDLQVEGLRQRAEEIEQAAEAERLGDLQMSFDWGIKCSGLDLRSSARGASAAQFNMAATGGNGRNGTAG